MYDILQTTGDVNFVVSYFLSEIELTDSDATPEMTMADCDDTTLNMLLASGNSIRMIASVAVQMDFATCEATDFICFTITNASRASYKEEDMSNNIHCSSITSLKNCHPRMLNEISNPRSPIMLSNCVQNNLIYIFIIYLCISAVHLFISSLTIPVEFKYIRGYATNADVVISVDNIDPSFPVVPLTGERSNFQIMLYYCNSNLTLGTGSSIQINANAIVDVAQLQAGLPVDDNLQLTGTHDGIITREQCSSLDFLCVELLPSASEHPSYSLFPSLHNIKCIDISTEHTVCDGKDAVVVLVSFWWDN